MSTVWSTGNRSRWHSLSTRMRTFKHAYIFFFVITILQWFQAVQRQVPEWITSWTWFCNVIRRSADHWFMCLHCSESCARRQFGNPQFVNSKRTCSIHRVRKLALLMLSEPLHAFCFNFSCVNKFASACIAIYD